MFDVGDDQAAGLRVATVSQGPTLMPVASPSQPARAYELLCSLAAHLKSLGHQPVIIDATAMEVVERRANDGSHLGLLHALQDGSVAGLGRPASGHEWLVMPGALGLKALQQTALNAGPAVALSRLLAPFASGALLLLFAPVHEMTPLLAGLEARVMVPVLAQPQSSIDAYGALKLLHMAGVGAVLAPLESETSDTPLQQVIDTIADCAHRHLELAVDIWSEPVWAQGVQASALARPVRHDTFHGLRAPRYAGLGGPQPGSIPSLWS